MKKITPIIISILLTLNTISESPQASTGGDNVNYNTYPYVGVLYLGNDSRNQNPVCTASLIDKKTVLTAAHCLYDKETHKKITLRNLRFVVWQNGAPDFFVIIKTASIVPGFNMQDATSNDADIMLDTFTKDAAILTLKTSVPLEPGLSIDPYFDPYQTIISSYGQMMSFDYFGLDMTSGAPKTGKRSLMSGDKCIEQITDLFNEEGTAFDADTLGSLLSIRQFLRSGNNRKKLFCSFNAKTDSIQSTDGDSGSPFIIKKTNKYVIGGNHVGALDISTSRNYSELGLISNAANNADFFRSCMETSTNMKMAAAGNVCKQLFDPSSIVPILNLLF
jgi:hypothetical protein